MNENEKLNERQLTESDLEKVAGGRLPRYQPEKYLSEEDREKLREFEKRIADSM